MLSIGSTHNSVTLFKEQKFIQWVGSVLVHVCLNLFSEISILSCKLDKNFRGFYPGVDRAWLVLQFTSNQKKR